MGMAELINKWDVVNKLIQLENNYQFYKDVWDAEVLYRRICELEIGIGKMPGVTDNNVGSKWIPVSERLPEKYGKYLCRYVFNESAEYPHIEAISYYPTMTRFQGEGSCGMRVTHWMYLPQPPKED